MTQVGWVGQRVELLEKEILDMKTKMQEAESEKVSVRASDMVGPVLTTMSESTAPFAGIPGPPPTTPGRATNGSSKKFGMPAVTMSPLPSIVSPLPAIYPPGMAGQPKNEIEAFLQQAARMGFVVSRPEGGVKMLIAADPPPSAIGPGWTPRGGKQFGCPRGS